MANTAGNVPRSASANHHANANGPSAFGRTLKNFHSLRSVSRLIMEMLISSCYTLARVSWIMRLFAALLLMSAALSAQSKFEVKWDKPLDGRVLLILSAADKPEPRMAVSEGLDTQQIFGADVDSARTAIIDGATLGYPRDTLSQIPAGDYTVQAVLNIYETFHRSDGHTVKLPMDQGEGQHWNRKPGNL